MTRKQWRTRADPGTVVWEILNDWDAEIEEITVALGEHQATIRLGLQLLQGKLDALEESR